ncbi:SIMPL domain-containing protein [Microbulbifer bruguierae]|uniref:SIMPL domain-containing protein n=1 Tax=Microbulbifer bruguierae TaxID=3029061 RepID=A0ABY8NE79_9GAMM|nr:SIMPL domain-containing protein [Microbulbifer bruguierae]WGL16744.1 SIMPL domain-containing protein [Microbulbifer bruguierae]
MHKSLKLFSASLLAGLLAFTSGCGNDADTHSSGTLISISAQGEASQAPDIANISAGVVTEASESNAAMQANAVQMEKLMKAIKRAGIDDKDVQTSGINLMPRYEYQPNRAREITGYQAHNTVNITVRKLDELSNVIDALAAEGANQIHGPSFSIGEPEPLLAEARQKALKMAQARAESYADALGTKVLRIVSISEGSHGGMPRPMMRAEMSAAKDSASTPVAPGETSVSVNLELVFELAK